MVDDIEAPLSGRSRNANALRALAKLIPAVGDGLEQLVFGPIEERRQQRVEATLREILQRLEDNGAKPSQAEEYANLLERAIPQVARATSKDTRDRFRDLLTNAAVLPDEDGRWAEARLAEQLLSEIDGPGLAILAQIARYSGPAPMAIVSRPVCQVVSEKDFDWANAALGNSPIGYDWTIVEEWARRLREKRLIIFGSHNSAQGGFGGVALAKLGELLVRWTVTLPTA